MKRILFVIAASAVVYVASASAAAAAETRVTLDNIEVTPTGTIWTGDIFSTKKSCKNKRKVTVFRVRGGADEKRGSTLSYKGSDQPGYFWAYGEDGVAPPGGYYAKVRKTDGCKADRSPVYELTP